ncbi:hypothetical protein [Cellulosimicrobium funkei]|uniref:hypothetical protein n=1 Tax=Cellulosimicrobium funkei TaxID=264251 RepID=UPI00341FEB73
MGDAWDAELTSLHRAVGEADAAARRARQARDDYIRHLVGEGVTAYRIAQTLGISQPAVAKIIRSA